MEGHPSGDLKCEGEPIACGVASRSRARERRDGPLMALRPTEFVSLLVLKACRGAGTAHALVDASEGPKQPKGRERIGYL